MGYLYVKKKLIVVKKSEDFAILNNFVYLSFFHFTCYIKKFEVSIVHLRFLHRINVLLYIYICIYTQNGCMIHVHTFAYHIKYAWILYMYISLI